MSTKKRRKRRKAKRISITSLMVFVLSVGLVFGGAGRLTGLRSLISFGSISMELTKRIEFGGKLNFDSGVRIFPVNDHLVLFEEGKMRLLSSSGEPVWEKTFNGFDPLVVEQGSKMLLVDQSTGDMAVLNMNGTVVSRLDGTGRIADVMASSKDHVVVRLADTNSLSVMDGSLHPTAKIDVPEGDILHVDLSETQKTLVVSLFNIENETLYSNILMYDLDGYLLGVQNYENEIIYDVKMVDEGILAVTESRMFMVKLDNEEVWSEPFDSTLNQFTVNANGEVITNMVILNKDVTDTRSENQLIGYNSSGERIFTKENIEVNIEKMIAGDDRLCYFGEDKVYIADDAGKLLHLQLLDGSFTEMYWISKGIVGLEYSDRLEIYALAN